ncbi:hypothetical protein EDB85DRAFT_2277316 [Lactarius pseudohatsudake]|nr:hypothetical protein EDB85DRAFT_2277316 [Lactarius pseudohatsudake]
MAAAQHLEHGQISSNSQRPSPSRNPGRGCVNPLSCLPILGQELPLDSHRDAEPQEGPSQFRVDVTVLRAENVPRLKNVFGLKFFVTVTSQAIEKKTPSVPAKKRTARWGESLGAFILQPSTPLILRLYAERFARRDILIAAREMIPVESQIGWGVGDALFDSHRVTKYNFRYDLAHQRPHCPIKYHQRLAFWRSWGLCDPGVHDSYSIRHHHRL